MDHTYATLNEPGSLPVKMWTVGVPVEPDARAQLLRAASMPFVHHHVAVMPDVHVGIGATVGSVIPTLGAIIPAAVGVDIGCGMMAAKTSLRAVDLPDNLFDLRCAIEKAVPHGRSDNGGIRDKGARGKATKASTDAWQAMAPGYEAMLAKHPKLQHHAGINQLGTLGTGNHFIELCLDEEGVVWIMLHSGSRGVGNRVGSHFIELAKKDAAKFSRNLPDQDLAYFEEGTEHFADYVQGVSWAQEYARVNRELMMQAVVDALRASGDLPPFTAALEAVNCHHNYVSREHHFGADVFVTRKGAVRAGKGELGIIPGSMGAKSFIVRGLGNPESFESCSHGAGRIMSRTAAKKAFTLDDHVKATEGVECRKDDDVIDETPGAYKDIEAVMHAQRDLVEVVHTLKQVLCVKG